MLDRNSMTDAEKLLKEFLPDPNTRHTFIRFIAEAIGLADMLNPGNWSLNMDVKGRFLRFNTGQVYCIDLYAFETLILCDRRTLLERNLKSWPFNFVGKRNGEIVYDEKPDNLPDLLTKVTNSVGALVSNECIPTDLHLLKMANEAFIKNAIQTTLLPNMRNAHSPGALDCIFSQYENMEPKEMTYVKMTDLEIEYELELSEAKAMNPIERNEKLKLDNPEPTQIIVTQTVFVRNQYVVAERLYRANGHCEHCGKPAPFIRVSDSTPYLEVHHILPLSKGGKDTVENTVALCPNCHRKAHFG